ncbi:Ig-like domain repeat protein [uncultured Methanobrevibacter sp.]|uniref:Ig-like domain repeat protein n=1 Tax=uncultured Methanobrevibacter sp. TaxID=253161 RepID=UPI0025F6E66E|nr:Ig-like domain repeat protein [uncultured Methanobrevibacter sp.]
MSIKKRFDKKLIILALLLVLIIGIGAVSAADNNTDKKLASSNDQAELSVTNNVKVSSSNESTLGANVVNVTGATFTDLRNAINGAAAGDVIVLNNDIENDISHYILIDVGKSITIEGNGHKIDALGKSGIFFIKGSGVVLNNITFINAKNHYPGGDHMYGGAIHWVGNNGILNNSIFINNTADPGNVPSGRGGAIYWENDINGRIYNSKFYNNHANLSGGALHVKSSIIIENSEFLYNDAPDGGAIHIAEGGFTGRIANCNFTANTAENRGGALYFYSNAMNVVDNYFTLNSAKFGGAAFAYANNGLYLDYQTVISNFAEYGGGFFLNTQNYCPVKVRYSTFLGNTAFTLGAGVYYNDTTNHVGYSDVDALNSPQNTMNATVHGDTGYLDWKISGWQNPVNMSYFGGSRDNYIGVTATPNNTDVAIEVSIPKDADKTSANITLVIKDESGTETTYTYRPSDSRWNYDDVNESARTVVTLYLTNQAVGEYNVTATFNDNRYYISQRKGNTTYTIERPKDKGNFTILQELINEAINNKSYVLNLDKDYTYSIGLDQGQMNIYDNITINGNGHFLDALGKCRIFSISGDEVVFNNIVFRNGNASGAEGTFHNYEYGGAIYWSSGDNATVNNCTFTNNYAYHGGALVCGNIGNVYINDTVFTHNTAGIYGGALYLYDNSNLIISNSTFKYGKANYGSAIYCNGDNYNIYSCNFTNNTAVSWSTIEWVGNYGNICGSNFTNNKASSNAAITFHGNNCTVSHCSFDSNNATTGYAGAILIDGNDNTISNCSFTNNSANRINGGSIAVLKDNYGYCYDTYIYDSTFRSGIAQNGGAIYFNNANLIVHNSTFEFNHAHVHGGAIFGEGSNSKSTIISNCTFKSNEATDPQGSGGAISYCTDSDDLTVSDCTFESNSQLGIMLPESPTADIINSGGAIYFEANILKIDNCNFTYNCVTADYVAKCYSSGGAITAYGDKCDISNSIFKHNSALKFGGAFETNIDDFTISNCTFEYNNASSGSAVLSWGDGGKVSNSTFLNNRADSDSLSIQDNDLTLTITLVGNDNYINAINIGGYLTFKNVTYYNGQTVNSDDVAPVKSQNEAGQTIVLEFDKEGHKITVNNKTDLNGQVIYDYSVLDVGIHFYEVSHPEDTYYTAIKKKDNVRFGEFDLLQHHINQADDNGVLNLVRNYTYTVNIDSIMNGVVINKKNLTINGNNHTIDALSKSRIFYVTSEDVVLNNITYKNGVANDGGAIFVNGSATNLIISNATFENNLAKLYGGAIFWNCSSGNINHAIFNNNGVSGSGTSGGAVFWNATYCNISYTSFTDNSAGNHGGALYSNADKTELDHVNFTRNQATNNGGAVWIKSDSTITNSNFINNKAIDGSGGAVWFNGGVTKLDHVNFTSNHAGGAGGGAILIYGTSATISNTYFKGDDARNVGGAIYLMAPNSRIEDSTFEGTHALNGGAVYLGGPAGTINNTVFIGTYSEWNGGAVYWNANDGTMTFTNFTDINSEGYGGAVYWLGDNANINYGNFTNTSGLSGGAIYLSGNNGAVSKSRFNNTKSRSVNNVEGGGAIHWISSNGNITDCNFTGASANNNGGAILLDSNNQRIANISIDNSKALKNGGAIYLSESASNANMAHIDLFNATASNGGGIYVNAVGVEFSDSNITNSSAINGGAIYWLCSGGNVYEIILSNNTANDGGALYARSKSGDTQSTTFADITFDNNNATGNGGAICFNGDAGGYSVYNSTFTDNGAGQKGNSIYYYAGSSNNLNNSVYNSNFTGTNHIYIENNRKASLVNNTELNTQNGDYFVYNKGTIALSNNSLKNLIVNYGTILTLVNVTVCENKTYTFDGIFFPLNATAVDDNGNDVVSNSLIFVTNHNDRIQSQIDDDKHIGTLITNKEHYEVNITDVGLKKVNVKIAIINVIAKYGSYTWLQKEIDNCVSDVYVLATNVTFNPDYDLSIYNIYYGKINFTNGMDLNKTIKFEGANFTISGLNQARIFTVTANNIIINNTNFVNGSTSEKGGALYITSNNAKIANSTFVNNTAVTGGAISSVSNSGLTLGNLTFFNNAASNIAAVELSSVSDVQIKDLDFINNTATNDCGALSFIASGNVQTLSDCNFINNTAGNDYGAVYVSNVNVDSCNFINNTAQDDYSALYLASGSNALTLTKSNFTGNFASNRATVGIGNAKAQVNNCNFTDNEVKSSGSAIYVTAQEVVISDNIFDKNVAGANGTVYFASTSGKILDSNFTNNKALNGAGVYTGTNAGIIISDSSFISNVASVEAGAIYLASQAGKIQNCNFTDNKAVNGGAVVLAGSNQDIGFCKFEGNNATYKGGSVYVKDGLSNTIHDTTFKKSYAFDGGAVYNSGSTGASLGLTNNTFIKNIASHNGGAVYYVVDADGANPVIYRDYINFTSDGITSEGVVDTQTGRTTVTMKSGGSTYQRIIDCLFQDNEDYILNISATKDDLDTMVIVSIRNPKDGDKKSIRIVITVNSTDGSYKKQIIINETNYDYYFNTYSRSFVVDFRNVTQDMDYNVTVSFEDAVYLYKLNSTSLHIGHGTKIGDFKYLQQLIDNATSKAAPGTIPSIDLPRNIVFTIGPESWCDDSCVNITSPITINGLGYTIDALGQSRIFNITSANVTLNDIKFVNGNSSGKYGDGVDMGGAIFWSGQNGTLKNCEFRDNNATIGGAIYYNSTASNAKIGGSYFFNNTAVTNGGAIDCNASEMNLTNTLFESNYAGEYGAALCRESNATGGFGRNNNFTANNAGKAGAALAWMGVNKITINNYIFIDNTAGENGGAIYVDANSNNCTVLNSVFEGNNVTSQTGGNGGAIDWLGANATVLCSNFTNNNAYDGGAIYIGSATGYTNITGSTFADNGAINNGGAINLVASSVTVNESNFYDNSAVNGGALYVGGEGTTNFVYSSAFVNNTATSGRGGAIDWVAAKGEIIGSNFTENSAEYGGGVYFGLKSKNSQIKNVIFTGNSATKNGGAIDWNSTDGELYNTQFISNYAGEYGAALCREANATGGHGNNNSFTSNHAGIAGAALAWMDSVGISITNYTFISNIADEKGGAIYINQNSHNCSIIECKFDSNEVNNTNRGHGGAIDCEAANATITNSSFTRNFAFEGGAIHVDSNSGHTNITNSNFTGNWAIAEGGAINLEASSVTVNGSNFIRNIASDGGALYVGGKGLTNYVYNSNFEFNDAGSGHGGAIGWLSSTGHIINSNFTSNSAEYGGGVYLNGNSTESQIIGSRFIGNSANTNGGAIDWNATSGILENNYFSNNYAGEYGAALCREANATGGHGYNNTFENNYAEIAGAALAWMNVGNIKIDTYRFYNNMAGVGGAAIYIGYGSDNSTILNCDFKGNNITNDTGGHGGAIYCVAENATINNTNFTNNHAFYGGAIFVGTGSGHTNITNTNFTNNGANVDGGALYLRSSSILNNTCFKGNVAGEDGGAVYVDGISQDNYVYSSSFEDNHANSGLGGAINWGSSAGYIVDSNFTLNTADYGGGIYLGGNSDNSRITNVIFANNTATHNGGAIDWNATGGNLTNTTFKGNRAEYGAALCREAHATGGFGYNNTFILNHATKSGAALAWMGVNDITIRKYTFINNTADFSGGAIYVSKFSDNCRVINSTFTDNYVSNAVAGRGGAIDWIGNNGTVINTTFERCVSINGGGIYVGDGSNNMTIFNTSFTSCESLTNGGAIVIYGDDASISYSNFTSSVALDNGGAIAGFGSDNTVIANCVLKYNMAAGHIDPQGRPYGEGGAIYWENSKNLRVADSIFEANDAHLSGGDISANHCDDSTIYNINTYNATASTNGGSLAWRNSKNLNVDKSYFNDSGAGYTGGSIYLSNIDATIKNSVINSSWASWDVGGGIYVDGDVDIDNVYFNDTHSMHDNATALYFKSGTSTVSNSNFTISVNSIGISKGARVTLTKNNISSEKPTKDTMYLVDGKYENVDYAVWNEGDLWLDKNTFDTVIFNNGTIWTPTTIKMLNNGTYNVTWNDNFTFFANITDDNKNTIISVRSLNTSNDVYTDYRNHYQLPYNARTLQCAYQGLFHLTAIDPGLKNAKVYDGTLYVKMPVAVSLSVDQSQDDRIIVTATLTPEVTSNYTADGSVIKFKMGDHEYNLNVTGCPNIWTQHIQTYTLTNVSSGNYTLTATYSGNDYHLGGVNNIPVNVALRDAWIKVVVQNILYGQNATVVITTNSNGTVRFNLHGKDEVIEVPIVNGTGIFNLTLANYTTVGNHSVGVVLEPNEYYKFAVNQTWFTVSKLNTDISAVPTTPIYVGNPETITVKVNENATGFVKITIDGKKYYEELDKGVAIFEIHKLPYGRYNGIDVEYLGDDHFNATSTKISFDVKHIADYMINVRVNNITYGENATIYASLPTDVANNITFVVNGTPYPDIKVLNGVAELTIPGLDVGEYPVVVVYGGDNKYEYKLNQTSFTVKPTDKWTLNITVEAHTYGQDTIFNVTLPQNVTKDVNLTIEGVNYTVKLINGTGSLTLNNISGGIHAVVATYDGDTRYLAKTNSTLFYIERAQSNVNLTQEGRNITATVTANATGWVKFIVNGKEQRIEIVNGNATWANVLINGNNTVVAIYEGDINFTDSNNSTNFTVSLEKSSINVTATNVTYGNASVITVKVPAVQTGYVTVVVNNGTDIIKVILPIPANGEIKLDASRLNVGEYKVNVTYLGDKTYDVSQNSTTFNITKANLTAEVIAQNVTVDKNASFVITVNNDFKGKVNVTVDGVSYFDDLAQALIYINKLPADDYVARMTFYGDGNYNNKTVIVPFTVSRVDLTVINVTIDDVTYPDKAVAVVNMSAKGIINITVDGKVFNGTIDNGEITIDLTGLSAGVKEALVNFTSTDAYHNNASTIVKFVVFKAKSQVNLTNESTSVVAKVTDGATGNVTFYVNGRNNTVAIDANGYARWDNALEIGNNTVVVVYNGDKNFNVSTNSTSGFTIPKQTNSTVNVTATNVTYGNVSIITVEVPKVQTGYVRIVVEGTGINVTVPIDPITGVAKFNATGIDVGRYRVNVTYLGDNLYDVASNFTYFNITKANLNAAVIPINVTVKEYPGFIVNVNNDFNGKVNITIGNVNKYADVVKPLMDIDKLLAGKYTANVTFYGDNNYIDTSLKVNFTVSKLGSMMVVTEVVNGTSVVVSLPENATGNVTVVFENGTSMVVNVTNGSAIINLENVTPGTQNITVIYSGDENYTGVTINSTITVPKHDTEIKIDVTDITDNGTAIVHVKVPTNATGDINVTIDGITYSGPINKGEAIIPVANLTSGTKTVIAEYAGDNNYSANYSVAKFDINVKTNVTPTVIDYGNGTVVVVVGDNATGNVTIKVGDKEFNATVVNGTAIVNITNVTPGDHEVDMRLRLFTLVTVIILMLL